MESVTENQTHTDGRTDGAEKQTNIQTGGQGWHHHDTTMTPRNDHR